MLFNFSGLYIFFKYYCIHYYIFMLKIRFDDNNIYTCTIIRKSYFYIRKYLELCAFHEFLHQYIYIYLHDQNFVHCTSLYTSKLLLTLVRIIEYDKSLQGCHVKFYSLFIRLYNNQKFVHCTSFYTSKLMLTLIRIIEYGKSL